MPPYIDTSNEDEELKKQQQGGQVSTSPETTIIGGSGAQSSGGGKGPQTWTNLQTYTEANKDQAPKLGQDVASNINQTTSTTEGLQNTYQSGYNSVRPTRNTEEDSEALASISNDAANNKNKISNIYNVAYTGPKSAADVSGYSDILTKQAELDKLSGNLNTTEGQTQILENVYGKTNAPYTQGSKALDAYLLGSNAQSNQELNKAQSSIKNTKNQWKQVLSDIGSSISQDQQYVDDLRTKAQDAVAGKIGAYNTQFSQGQADLKTEALRKEAELRDLYSMFKKDPNSAYSKLGLTPELGNMLDQYGYDYNRLISPTANRALGDIVNPQDTKNYATLAEIANKPQEFTFDSTGGASNAYNLNNADVEQAKKAQSLMAAIQNQLAQEQKARDELFNQAKTATTPLPWVNDLPYMKAQADILGLPVEDYIFAQQNGIDLTPYVREGLRLNIGDSATNQQKSEWEALRNSLGLSQAPSLADTQSEGQAFSVGDIMGAIQAKRAESKPAFSTNIAGQTEEESNPLHWSEELRKKAEMANLATNPIGALGHMAIGSTLASQGGSLSKNVKKWLGR